MRIFHGVGHNFSVFLVFPMFSISKHILMKMKFFAVCIAFMCFCSSCTDMKTERESVKCKSDMPKPDKEKDADEAESFKRQIDSCYVDGKLIIFDHHRKGHGSGRSVLLCYVDLHKPGYSYTRDEIEDSVYANYYEEVRAVHGRASHLPFGMKVNRVVLSTFSAETIQKMTEENLFPFVCIIKFDWTGKIRSIAFDTKLGVRQYIDGRQIIKMTEAVKRGVKYSPMPPTLGHSLIANWSVIDARWPNLY